MIFSRLIALFVFSVFCFPTTLWLAPDPKTIEAAKKERSVAYYTGLNVNAVQRLAGAFEQRYPFLKVEPARQGHVQVRTRILTESLAGAHRVDVVSMPAIDLQLLKKKGLLALYRSPELDGIPKGLKDEEGFWAAMYVTQFIIGYNHRMIAKNDRCSVNCTSFDKMKSASSLAAFGCGEWAETAMAWPEVTTGSTVRTQSRGAPLAFISSTLCAWTTAKGNSPAAII